MNSIFNYLPGYKTLSAPWDDPAPVREELFGMERLELHGESLAAAQPVTLKPRRVLSLQTRLNENADVLLAAYKASAQELENGRGVVPAAEWLLDNYHVVEQQIRGIRNDLPPGYYRQLPKLAEGPFAGYPRVFGIAWAFVAHTDSHFDPDVLRRFLAAYQRVQPLTIGELWAVAITLRFVLIENLRRLADQITAGRAARADADALASAVLVPGASKSALEADIARRRPGPLSEPFAGQLAKRLRDQDPHTTPALGWLEERLAQQNTTIEEVVQHAHLRQVASNVTVRNVITSMRLISSLDWAELFESVSLADDMLRTHSAFAAMDFPTRNLYRSAIEQLARGSSFTELQVTQVALDISKEAAATETVPEDAELKGDPGYYLIGKGRCMLEDVIDFKPPASLRINRFNISLGIGGYVGAIFAITAGLLAIALHQIDIHYPFTDANTDIQGWNLSLGWLILLGIIGFIPASEIATALINRLVTCSFGAVTLPGLELAEGVPVHLRTLVVIPTLLTNEADIMEQVERLEVHYLGGATGDLTFALLTDGLDADQETTSNDAHLLGIAAQGIAQLNLRHGPGPNGNRFLLLHRRRLFNAQENKWMGWERKRGKLHELNQLLRGSTTTTFIDSDDRNAPLSTVVPENVRYVITLDADTRLPRDAALRLIGKMAHPLNRAKFSPDLQRVTEGYGILQPRVTPSLPLGREGSVYQQVFSSPGGMDPYAAAVSDVYQDMFSEGSFTGKGIYDVDAFEAAMAERVPENTMLSHDLFEGTFARAGLASDVEVVEEFPARYDVANKRQHRWTRGDWQLLPWIFGHWGMSDKTAGKRVPALGRWKMFDNLRRSLVAPMTIASLGVCWLLPATSALAGTLFILMVVVVPAFMPSLLALLPNKAPVRYRNHYRVVGTDAKNAALQTLLLIAFLPDQAWRMLDAIVRTLSRFISRRHLLEWTTAAQSACAPELDAKGFYQQMFGGTVLGVGVALLTLVQVPANWPIVLPFIALWITAPALALWASRGPTVARGAELDVEDADALRLIARRTWRFFETFVTEAENFLPPDNFQDNPKPVVAHRTSPTNIGLYMLSALTARDFGWASTNETLERLEATLGTMQKMQLFRGHFYNWYATVDLRPLEPAYVSSVDSGNLAGHLIAIANACETWIEDNQSASLLSANAAPRVGTPKPDVRRGIRDNLHFAYGAIRDLPAANGERGHQVMLILQEIENLVTGSQSFDIVSPNLRRLAEKAVKAVDNLIHLLPSNGENNSADVVFWVNAVRKTIVEHSREYFQNDTVTQTLNERLQTVANTARAMALAMDFAFLLEPKRKLLSIGYSIPDNHLDSSCYDLLASEARLASLFAIAKGDVNTKHWFRLGRSATPIGTGSALISWSGSMFEYLMPSLVMRAPLGSLLEQTTRLVVKRQEEYGWSLNIPWGVSESAYNARDMEFTYQYSNFGVPGLGLKTGLADNVVIAPYATGLATMVDARGARRNYARLADMGAFGRYGFYEALDFTRARLPDNKNVAIVHNFMAHHQGMTIVAIANTLHDGLMRSRFHREPMIKACELLLQERLPRNIPIETPRAEEVKTSATERKTDIPTVRRLNAAVVGANARPITHLLSNGRYSVMLTATGAGYSRWRDIAVTRWREDATRDDWGSFIFMRDTQSGKIWSCGMQPASSQDEWDEVNFGEDHAEFIHHDATLTTTMEVAISSEDDSEVRRISLVNSGRRARKIELTSYAEIVLTTPSADNAHPVFSKMFVQTEYLEEFGALIATRRPRLHEEQQLWAAHFAVVEGEIVAPAQYESDRLRFIGRGHNIGSATAIKYGKPLSNTTGTVLDPIFSTRQRVIVQPGEVVRVSFWTLLAQSRAELLDLIDKHHDRHAFDRARTLAWTQAQVQLRHLDIDPDEAADFQRLAAPIIYADAHFRMPSDVILRGAGQQSGLWSQSISGDLPIVLLRIDDIDDFNQVKQLLRAHEYWRMKRLAVDLVIINERASSYVQDLQIAIETAVRASQARHNFGAEFAKGAAYPLRADLLPIETRNLLQSVARVVLHARHGTLASQLADKAARQAKAKTRPLRRFAPRIMVQPPAMSQPSKQPGRFTNLEFFNGLGGFGNNGKEYVTILDGDRCTPAPWINVIANPNFGFQVSTEGSGYTWAQNSRENQLTPWSNDPVADPAGEAIYVHDDETLDLWTATAQPIRDGGTYIARHGHGYSRFEHEAHDIALELLQYVPLNDPIKISRLVIRNLSDRPRQLTVTAYAEWVMGTSRSASSPYITTEIDSTTGALLARNPWNTTFPNRVAFTDLSGKQTDWTADRTEFLGRGGGSSIPTSLAGRSTLSKTTGAGLDPCAALQYPIELGIGETVEVVSFIGLCPSTEEVIALINKYRSADLDAVLAEVTKHWDELLGTVQVKTPDRSMDIMLNGWLLYQTVACRIWARSAFYQASGAYGFRDQLQDGMALTFARPEATRSHLLRAASRQFPEGDVQHWWLPHSGQGVRTKISDDRVWLAYATATYITTAGDPAVLDEVVPFLEGQLLKPEEHDAFFHPMVSNETASLFEHCARGLDQCIQLTGEHGLPLIGTGDWNDGMSRVGENGKGESVWLGWLFIRTVQMFAPYAEQRDPERAQRWRAHAETVRAAIENSAWDGEWYRRATFDDGTWLGSKDSDECQIDSIAQSWAILSNAAQPERAATAMASLEQKLIKRDAGMALLFTPPFDKTPKEPGYIKGYPAGLRENGGQYSHAAMWVIFAYAHMGAGDKAAELFSLLNPVNHTRTLKDVDTYKVEPYAVAADVYSVGPHLGRGGWTWYTGAAGWMYRSGINAILGIRREGESLVIDPCIPADWPGYSATVNVADTSYTITVDAPSQRSKGITSAELNGTSISTRDGSLRLALDKGNHHVKITL